jgi:predicted lipid-binding transport protein (Tim44 family)
MDDDSRETAEEMTTPAAMDAPTDALPAPTARPHRSVVAGTAGVLVAVLVLLGIGMLVAQVVGAAQHHPGPGALAVGAHVAGAVVGIWCYRLAGRRSGLVRWLGFVALPVLIVALLWIFWWLPV